MLYSNDKFKLLSEVKNFIFELDTLVANIPRKDLYNKDEIGRECKEILRLILIANNTSDKEDKVRYQNKILANIGVIDFLLERAYIYKYISEKQLYKYTKRLEVIIKMTKGWIKS